MIGQDDEELQRLVDRRVEAALQERRRSTTRRAFMGALGLSGAALFGGTVGGATNNASNYLTAASQTELEYLIAGDFFGGNGAGLSTVSPESGRAFLETDAGENNDLFRWHYGDGSSWSANGIKAPSIETDHQTLVNSSDDLPDPTNGTHTLEDNTAYVFRGFVTSPYGLEPGDATPIVGRHGSVDGFIHTGGGTAITGTNAGFFARDVYVHAPGGTLFDLAGDQSTEMLVESCAFSDAAGIAPIASLGTIDGYRVPSFKGCNFEDFSSGLTFDGSPDKIFISQTPFRGVTTAGVTILTFAGSLDVDIVDMPNNYVKGVQSDTEVVRVETGGTPNDVFQYRGNTHDSTVTTSNILNGEAAVDAVGYRITNSYPLRDSAVIGELSLDTATTTTISSADTYTQVEGSTTLGNESVRVTQVSPGVLRYDGKKGANAKITASCTVEAPSNETFAVAVAKNGTVEPTSEVRAEGRGNAPVAVAPSSIEDIDTGETLSLHCKNIDGANDLTFDLYNLNFAGL